MTAAATQQSPLAPGYKLDRYELLCPIAEGGMASVWVARQQGKHGFEKLVAIKTILPVFASDTRFQEMFLDEARIASRIDHANVTHILDLGEEEEVLYLAMEYVDGDSLSKLNHACLKQGARIPPPVLLRILSDTCAGLHEAHELLDANGASLEIVHRDVSPHNILVSTKGVAKLIDFGIAKARSRAGGDTNSGILKGKIQYMAPEQALGIPADRRVDIWAVGVILYYILSGRPPYEAENHLAALHLLSSGRPPAPLPPSVNPALAAIVRRALAHSPANRYQTAQELREALERAMVDTKSVATQADVAAFSHKFLGERAEKRRQAIDLALVAAERRRQANVTKPASGTETVARAGSNPGSIPPGPPPAARTYPSSPPSDLPLVTAEHTLHTTPDTPYAKELSPKSRSDATIGSASIDTSAAPAPSSRRPLAIGILLGVLAVAAGVTLALIQPKPQPRNAALTGGTASAPAVVPAPVVTATSAPRAAATSPADAARANPANGSAPAIPVIAPSSLPKAREAAPPSRAASPPPAPAAPASRPKSGSKSQVVDDGF